MADFTATSDSYDEKGRRRILARVYATILSWPIPENKEIKISIDENGSPDAGNGTRDDVAGLLDSGIVSDKPILLKGTIHHVNDI